MAFEREHEQKPLHNGYILSFFFFAVPFNELLLSFLATEITRTEKTIHKKEGEKAPSLGGA